MAKGNVGVVVGLVAMASLVLFLSRKKNASASPSQEAQPADLGAQYMAALGNVINTGGSFDEYKKILKHASDAGVFTPDELTSLLGRHPDASAEQKANARLV